MGMITRPEGTKISPGFDQKKTAKSLFRNIIFVLIENSQAEMIFIRCFTYTLDTTQGILATCSRDIQAYLRTCLEMRLWRIRTGPHPHPTAQTWYPDGWPGGGAGRCRHENAFFHAFSKQTLRAHLEISNNGISDNDIHSAYPSFCAIYNRFSEYLISRHDKLVGLDIAATQDVEAKAISTQ